MTIAVVAIMPGVVARKFQILAFVLELCTLEDNEVLLWMETLRI